MYRFAPIAWVRSIRRHASAFSAPLCSSVGLLVFAQHAEAQVASIEYRVSFNGALGAPITVGDNQPGADFDGDPGELLVFIPAQTDGVMTLLGGGTIQGFKVPGANGRDLLVTGINGHANAGAFPATAGTIDIYACYRFNGPGLTVPAPNRFIRHVDGDLTNFVDGTIDLAAIRHNAMPNGACAIGPGDPGFYSQAAFGGAAGPIMFFDTVVYGFSPVPVVDITSVSRLTVYRDGDTVTMPGSAEAIVVHEPSVQLVIAEGNRSFVDISSSGNSPGTSLDDAEFTVTSSQLASAGFLGNELLSLADIRIGNNGAVLWNANTGEVGYINNRSILSMAASSTTVTGNGGSMSGVQLVCPLWDDHVPSTGQGANALDWRVLGGDLYIQWSNEDHFNAQGTGTVRFQMIVRGGATIASGQPLVEFVYDDTLYSSPVFQNDGGSATIGFKNWGVVSGANDVQYLIGGGSETLGDPAYGETNMQPKVAGWSAAFDNGLPHSITIRGMSSSGVLSYCTAGTTTNFCTATMSHSGAPSLSLGPGGFILHCNGVESQKQGIIFYGVFGGVSVPWGVGGTSLLCVKAPTQRTVVQSSGGVLINGCDGSLSLDVFQYFQSNPNALGQPITAGDQGWFQSWFRDPPATKTTSLSDALEVTYSP